MSRCSRSALNKEIVGWRSPTACTGKEKSEHPVRGSSNKSQSCDDICGQSNFNCTLAFTGTTSGENNERHTCGTGEELIQDDFDRVEPV